jgi:subtilisin family serine protease
MLYKTLFIVLLFIYGCGNNTKPYARSLSTGAFGGSGEVGIGRIDQPLIVTPSYIEPLHEDINRDESSLDEVIGVGASDEENLRAIYSNFGKGIDLIAPGGYEVGISTTGKDNTIVKAEDVNYFAGTSASAPIVTSLIALMLEADPTLTRTKIQSILSLGADKIGNVPYLSGRNPYYGFGKVNFEKTLQIVEKLR